MQSDYTKLKSLLLQEEIDKIDTLTRDISSLQNHQERDVLVERLSLLITDILSKSIEKNQTELYATLQPVIAKGLVDQLHSGNSDLKRILLPIIATSLQEQIHKQKETIIDALYPIMGNMISKYVTNTFKEMMYEVNDKIQDSFSLERVHRKIKSKIFGVTEAELLMQEADFVDVRNVFLIHKESGLLITDVHKADAHRIDEVDMVASMLSAIRSFVNEWISTHNTMNEISEIDYGSSSILIESAGSCYLAVVLNGNSNIQDHTTKALAQIVDLYSKELTYYDGDGSTMDLQKIQKILYSLFETKKTKKERKTPLISISLLLLLLAFPLYYFSESYYYQSHCKAIEKSVKSQLQAEGIHIYDLNIDIKSEENITLSGLVLDQKEYEMTKLLFAAEQYHNQVEYVKDKFHEKYTVEELKKEIYKFNSEHGSAIAYLLEKGTIKFSGTVADEATKRSIVSLCSNLFDDYHLLFTIKSLSDENDKVYFTLESAKIESKYDKLLDKIATVSQENSEYMLKIIAYTDRLGTEAINKKIALERIENIKQALVKRGVSDTLLSAYYEGKPPPNILKVESEKEQALARCIAFKWEMKQ